MTSAAAAMHISHDIRAKTRRSVRRGKFRELAVRRGNVGNGCGAMGSEIPELPETRDLCVSMRVVMRCVPE